MQETRLKKSCRNGGQFDFYELNNIVTARQLDFQWRSVIKWPYKNEKQR